MKRTLGVAFVLAVGCSEDPPHDAPASGGSPGQGGALTSGGQPSKSGGAQPMSSGGAETSVGGSGPGRTGGSGGNGGNVGSGGSETALAGAGGDLVGSGGASVSGEVPAQIQTFADEVDAASLAAHMQDGPLVCSAMIPSVPLADDADIEAIVRESVSAWIGAPAADTWVDHQNCGTSGIAGCASRFQNDLAHLGGTMPQTTFPLAQRIESEADHLWLGTLTPVIEGISQPVIVVLAGIQNGWLVSIATFADRSDCK